ncbi:MAG: hypothetical protein FWG85_05480 [Bacteroidetes bacterium]|nr:hypothetical protein [Bacteroidota bacterium]
MLNITKYQGNGALTEHSDYTSSYAHICSKITTSNVVETTTRGGGFYYKPCSRITTNLSLC